MLTSEDVRRGVETLLSVAVCEPPTAERGYVNENWRVVCADRSLLLKVARPGAHVGKAIGASRAQQLGVESGAPVPRELIFDPECAAFGGRVVRAFELIEGVHAEMILTSEAVVTTFFTSLGRAVGRLHTAACDGFSSRVGGEPSFSTWLEYVTYRVPQIAERARASGMFSEAEIGSMFDRALALAEQVSPVVEPRLTHRDLYLDNVLASRDGEVVAIVDFDSAEAWDPAADLVKLRWQVFPRYPGAAEAYARGYATEHDPLPLLEDRVRVAEVLELSNHAVGAQLAGWTEFAAASRHRLDEVLAASW